MDGIPRFVGLVALIHVYILVLEMFLWDRPIGLRTFNMDLDFAIATRICGDRNPILA